MLRSDAAEPDRAGDGPRDLSELTGVRSGKNSYYRELRRTEERMTSAVRALEVISTALLHTRDDPRELLRAVLHAASEHLASDWTMIALRRGALPDLDGRFLAVGPGARLIASELSLPAHLRDELARLERDRSDELALHDQVVCVPLAVGDNVLGRLIASRPVGGTVEHEDLWVLRILVNQAAVAMHTATMHATAATMRRRAQSLYDEIARSSEDLETRTAELARAQDRLRELHERELLDAERHRIALELHDSVAQHVLSAGLAVDVCRADAVQRGDDANTVERLVGARDLIAAASEQVRSVIYALHHEPAGEQAADLTQLLRGMAAQHRRDIAADVRAEGRPVPLAPEQIRALARIAGEALFNVVAHAKANRAVLRLRYTGRAVLLTVSDDGTGDPRDLRRLLRLEQHGDSDGRHQGLAGMASRARGIGATFAIRRAPIGGVRIGVNLPLRTHEDEENA